MTLIPAAREAVTNRVCSRRECLKNVGAAVLGAAAFGRTVPAAAADDPQAKSKGQIKLGIVADIYSQLPLEDAVRRIRADGFSNVLSNFVFADVRFDPWSPDWEAAKKITSCFDRHGVRVASLYGYYNVVDPDSARRQRGEARMEFYIANWKRFGCPIISTETGTFNRTSEWLDAPENATEEGYTQCRAAFEKLARAAEKTGAIIAIETYWRNVISSIERAARLFRDVPSPALKLVMDPCNFFRKEQLPQMQAMLQEMFQELGERIVVAHAKDVKAAAEGTDLPAAGQGVLDYPLYLRLLTQLNRPMDLIIEHLTLPDVARARDFVLAKF